MFLSSSLALSFSSRLDSLAFSLSSACFLLASARRHSNTELAMNWVLEHMGDSDFNDPLPAPGAATGAPTSAAAAAGAGETGVDAEALVMLTSLGFTDRQASAALKATGGDAARGADWLFSHTDDLDKAVAEVKLPSRSS